MDSDSQSGSFPRAILDFVRRAGTERSTARLVGEMLRFTGTAFSVHRVSLFLADDDDEGRLAPFVSELASGDADPALFKEWRRLDAEQFDVVKRIRGGEDIVEVDDPRFEGIPLPIVEKYDLQPYLAFALRRDGRPIGVLIVEGTPAKLRNRRDDLAVFSEYLAMGLANARAFERERRRAREAEALLDVGEVLSRTTDLIPVLASVAQNCARVAGFDRCSVFLVGDDGKLHPKMSQFADGHVDQEAWELFKSTAPDLPAAYQVLRTGTVLAFDDPKVDSDLNPEWWATSFGIEAALYLPLIAWGETFGVLVLDRNRPHRITDGQIRLARGVAAQGAVAIGLTRALAGERAAKARLEELDALKTTFVAAVSHELRTPLTTIIGFGSLLDAHVTDPEGRDFLSLIQRESAHLETLISNLLMASNIEAGVLELRRDRVDVSAVVQEAVELVGRLFPGRRFNAAIDDGLTLELADAGCLRQVFINLIQNAAKYSPEGSSVTVSARGEADTVRVEVSDQGSGIPPEERELVFERFQRGRNKGVQGTGIGLYLVRELVHGHQGKVWVEDGPAGIGARFVTVLPVSVPAASAA
ncbi:MAG: ATP-binding protein [Acidimicrobiia bacterium]